MEGGRKVLDVSLDKKVYKARLFYRERPKVKKGIGGNIKISTIDTRGERTESSSNLPREKTAPSGKKSGGRRGRGEP